MAPLREREIRVKRDKEARRMARIRWTARGRRWIVERRGIELVGIVGV
jgi:hypothetical protein